MSSENPAPEPVEGDSTPIEGESDPIDDKSSSFRVGIVVVAILAVFAAGLLTGTFIGGDGDDDAAPASPLIESNGAASDDLAASPPATEFGSGNDDLAASPPAADANAVDLVAPQPTGVVFNPFTEVDYGSGPCAPAEGAVHRLLEFGDAPALCIDPSASYTAVIDTSAGVVEVALDTANTPGTVNNFVNLARYGYYDNTLIHRSDPSIGILQAGSPHTNNANDPGPGYTIWDEGSGFAYRPGLLAMARTAEPNSADAQFFFTVTDAASLLDAQGDSVVFGQITAGLDALTAILNTHQDQPGNDFGGAPNPPAAINTITIHTTVPIAQQPAATSPQTSYRPFTEVDYGAGPCAPAEGAVERVLEFGDAPALCIDPSASYTAVIDTSAGVVEVALDTANTPGTVNNFVNLARYGYYDNTLIHRSDPSIGILQAGSPHTNNANDPGPGYTIWDEGSGFAYRPGLLAMARTAEPNSADAQFFFTVTDAASLLDAQGDSVVFGQITAGLDALTAILNTHQDQPGNDFGGAPNPPAAINTITIHTTAAPN